MRRALILLLVIVAGGRLLAQSGEPPSQKLLGATEIHCGVSTQALVYFGARQFISDQFFAEIGIGGLPQFTSDINDHFGHTLGVGFTPYATRQNGSGLFYSLLYTFLSQEFMSSQRDYHHLLTANIGYIAQQADRWGIHVRVGGGIFQENSLQYYDYYYSDEISDVVFGYPDETYYSSEIHPWLNLEIGVGFAF